MLRTRIIQMGIGVRLLCCCEGKPWPTIRWQKDGRELHKSEYNMTAKDGVITLDITGCRMEDAGKYTCIASNHLGTTETSCSVIVEAKRAVSPSPVRGGSPSGSRLGTPLPYINTVPTPLEAYYNSGGASTVIREARASSVFNTRSSSVRRDSISSLLERSTVSNTAHHSTSTSRNYQHQSSYTSSIKASDRYSSARTTSYDGGLRASSVTGFRRAESPRVHSPISTSSYSRPSALPSHSSSYRTGSPTLARMPVRVPTTTTTPSTGSSYGRTRKAAGKLDGKCLVLIF